MLNNNNSGSWGGSGNRSNTKSNILWFRSSHLGSTRQCFNYLRWPSAGHTRISRRLGDLALRLSGSKRPSGAVIRAWHSAINGKVRLVS